MLGGWYFDGRNWNINSNTMECFDADFDNTQLNTGQFSAHLTTLPFWVKDKNIFIEAAASFLHSILGIISDSV